MFLSRGKIHAEVDVWHHWVETLDVSIFSPHLSVKITRTGSDLGKRENAVPVAQVLLYMSFGWS